MAQGKSRTAQLNGLTSLAYVGVLPSSPTNFFIKQSAPTANDYRSCYVGDLWLNNASMYPPTNTPPTVADLWILVSVANHVATWVNFGGGSGTLSTLTGNTGGAVPATAGNINIVGDGVTISIAGNPGTSTLVASVIGSTGTSSSFLYIQSSNVANVTGDGSTYQLGQGVALTQVFDVGGNVFPGDGAGNPAYFTAPAPGQYYLEVGIQLTNLLAGVFNDTVATYSIVTPNRTYTAEFSPLGVFNANAMVSDSGAISQGYLVDLAAGDQVTFNCISNLGGGGGVKNIGVGGQADPVVTFICGFIVGQSGSGAGSLNVITDSGTAVESAGAIYIESLHSALNCGSSVKFTGATNRVILDITDSSDNTIMGAGSGNLTLTGANNVSLGTNTLPSITSGSNNLALGNGAGVLITTESNCVLVGNGSYGAIGVGGLTRIMANGSTFLHNYPGDLQTNGSNIFLGEGAGNFTMGTSGVTGNIGIGAQALELISSGVGGNIAIGDVALAKLSTGTQNTCIGKDTGFNAFANTGITSGSYNTFLGFNSGEFYTSSESSNILIGHGNGGSVGESNVCRIGRATGSGTGEISKTFISGIYSVTPTIPNPYYVVVDASGQLGAISPVPSVVTFTPGVTFGGSSTGVTYASQSGRYIQNGLQVAFAIDLQLTNKGSSVGQLVVTGLPFAAQINTAISVNIGNATFPANSSIAAIVSGGGGSILIRYLSSGNNPINLTNANCTNTLSITVAGTIII